MLKFSNLLFFIVLWFSCTAQPDWSESHRYTFVQYNGNRIVLPDSGSLNPFYRSLKDLLVRGDRQVHILHIGDSHIQADFFTGEVRYRLQTYFQSSGGRGFIFPYSLAHTNNPSNYKVQYTGSWQGCRNVEAGKSCVLGLSGISATTADSNVSVSILPSESMENGGFSRVRIYYVKDSAYNVSLKGILAIKVLGTDSLYTEWKLPYAVNSFTFDISKKSGQGSFSLLGIELLSDDPGIIYSAVGVNGAEVISFLRCALMTSHIQSISPDLVIVSLGTNDAFRQPFNDSIFIENYTTLIRELRSGNPDLPVLLTTPGDCCRNRKYPNRNNASATSDIFRIASENHCAVWDFYHIMGGLGSIKKWFGQGLSSSDRIHLTQDGYRVQGDLFAEALIESFNDYLKKRPK